MADTVKNTVTTVIYISIPKIRFTVLAPMCSPKTRNKGRRDRKNYAPSLNYKLSDRKRIEAMDAEIQEFTIEELTW